MITKNCEICGKPFEVKPYRAKKARFCSFICSGHWHMANRSMPNQHKIGNTWRKGLRPTNAFTSEQVRVANSPRLVVVQEFICEHCGKTFAVKPWLVRQNGTPRFCSHECFHLSGAFLGNKSPCWVGGKQTYRGRTWHAARLLAIERDKGTCRLCGRIIGNSIPVHHVRPFRDFPTTEAANSLDNLICLCQSCHMKQEDR